MIHPASLARPPAPIRWLLSMPVTSLRYPAAIEDIDFRTPRGLDRSVMASFAGVGWVSVAVG